MSDSITICYEADINQFGAIAVPTATILPFAGVAAPSGYLLCDGAEILEAEYANLFSAIGSTYGVGQAPGSFKLPDLRGRAPIGAGQGDGLTDRVIASADGAEVHQLTIDEMPSHSHDWDNGYRTLVMTALSGGVEGSGQGQTAIAPLTETGSSRGGDQPHNNMQPFLVVNYIIKV
ncbi:phage tail protein [Thalassospira lucentensis]|uniref:phage tail protein n=1 Tax=Thalassospira lucentensis TaxID=168935 RepID=UPI003D2EEDFB